ncbi:ABC transporter substrate-binding protein [Lachnoclostridium sp. Marseille-P6806]|uniref:ABC transporter substrate-binding protein n=1 Tax=Lachnoclostridium sp. Marseille-P6806 TaxID=2364793 RepID=UPI0013EF51F1|nr:extracellular solute-binding protein [Lachnoclostridium sp. Marseille-P6806]
MKKVLAVLISGVLASSLLAGCGQDAGGTAPAETESAAQQDESAALEASEAEEPTEEGSGKKTITVSIQTGTGVQAGWDAVAAAYEEKNPDVDVIIDLKAADGYDQWVQTAFTSENPAADIVNINLAGDTSTGKAVNFSDYIDNDSPYSDGTWGEQFDVAQQKVDMSTGEMTALSLQSVQVVWLYNQSVFDEVGVSAPETWDELIDVCKKLKDAGYQPIAMPGDYDSFYSGTMGWLAQVYADQTTRSMVEKNRAQEGDYCYDPDIDGVWEYDPSDPWNDDAAKLTQNPGRAFANVKDGVYTGDTAGMKTVWKNFAEVFPEYAGGDAFFGTNADGAKTLFYQGKAAMMVNGAWGIIDFMNDMAALESGGSIETSDGEAIADAIQFDLGSFNMPSMEGEGIEAKARTIEVANGFLGVISKGQEHDDLVLDFLMFFSSKEGQSICIEESLKAGGNVAGSSLVYGVEYPEEIQNAFSNLTFIGNVQKDFNNLLARGIGESAETFRDFYQYSYDYLSGAITVDEWAEKHEQNIMNHVLDAMAAKGVGESDLANPQNEPTGN